MIIRQIPLPYSYHGYWASDFTKLNKHLGTEQRVQSITGCRSQQGNENHGGRCVKPCRLRYRKKYFNSILTDADGNSISMIRDSNNTISGDDKYDSLSDLPDFVTENKAVTDQLVAWQTRVDVKIQY